MPEPIDYVANTHKSKQVIEPKVIEKVVVGEVVKVKPSFGKRFKSIFISEDGRTVMQYVTADVILPAIRDLIVNTTIKGVERMVWGESSARRRQPTYTSRVQYNAPVRRPQPAYLPDQPPRGSLRQVRRETNDYILSTREEAEAALTQMIDIIEKYDSASIADLHAMMGLPSSHVDNKWGWTYLNNTEIRQVRDGYLLELPPAEEL
jgi:hypothetical protein